MNYNMPQVRITSPFWLKFQDRVTRKVLPYQLGVIQGKTAVDYPPDPSSSTSGRKATYSHALRNLENLADGVENPVFDGALFSDTDVYKWLEAVSYLLQREPNNPLGVEAGKVVDIIARAQQSDGYLDSFIQISHPDRRFKRLEQSHELYCMGHGIEALVAYWEAVGENGEGRKALAVACRMGDCIDSSFGPQPGKIHGVDGHPEIELALGRLGVVSGERKYLRLADWFLHERGRNPDFFEEQNRADGANRGFFPGSMPKSYYQVDQTVERRRDAVGHAVRMVYLCIGLAHVGRFLNDSALVDSARRMWESIVTRRMFITGAVGSTHVGEAFTYDYDLPNATMYGETCASVAMAIFARRMLENEADGGYGDVLEKELFNGTISGMSLDGRHYFYVNPLQANPKDSRFNPDYRHVLVHRAGWFQVACCPANLARLVESLDRYVYARLADGTILASQFIASQADFDGGKAGNGVHIEQTGNFPWDGDIAWSVSNYGSRPLRFGVRIPGWSADRYRLDVDGKKCLSAPRNGFVYLSVAPSAEVDVRLRLDMSVRLVRANNRVEWDEGKIAVMRGPIVYCAEQADNPGDLWRYSVEKDRTAYRYHYDPSLLEGVGVIDTRACLYGKDQPDPLYLDVSKPGNGEHFSQAILRLIPYYAWANRSIGQMRVWLDAHRKG